MSKIKSLDELVQLKDSIVKQCDENGCVKLLVSMATCGIAAGSKDTMAALNDEISALGLKGVVVTSCGCNGMCFVEPTVEVVEKGKENVMYGNVTPEKARLIVKALKNGGTVQDLIVEKPY